MIPAPFSRTSPSAPASVATHAVPVAMASSNAIDNPSTRLGSKKTSAI
tara:strand:- start:147 stop:290 length:144 start_codon:yes stop_codon:yes gene_type:complete